MDIWLIILIVFSSIVYVIGGISYIMDYGLGTGFLCKTYKNVTTKIGFIIFLMIDIIMFPLALMCYLIGSIVLLFEKIIFRKKD